MYNSKSTNFHQYLYKHTWLHTLSPKIKIGFLILWFILSFYCPLTIFGLAALILILLNFYLKLSTDSTLLDYLSSIYPISFSNLVTYIIIILVLYSIISQHFLFIQITKTKINYKYLQYFLLINLIIPQYPSNKDTLSRILIFYSIIKQYTILMISLYCCKVLNITTREEELIITYLALFTLNRKSNINRIFFCFSVTKQYERLIIDKIINILYSIKFRSINFYSSNFIYYFTHLIIFYLEIFINKLLTYSQTVSECLYSRELIFVTTSFTSSIFNN